MDIFSFHYKPFKGKYIQNLKKDRSLGTYGNSCYPGSQSIYMLETQAEFTVK